MRVVVTGATSMIGVAIINECLQKGHEVLAIVRPKTKRLERLPLENKALNIVYSDLNSLEKIHIDYKPYDVFYHMAWAYTSKIDRDNPVFQEKNIESTMQAVMLAQELGCKKFIGAGSQAEYGISDRIIDEETPTNPIIAYGMAKLSAYMLSKRLCEQYKIQHIWGRIFSVYGINDNDGTMIDYALEKFEKGEVAVFSSGKQKWNYLHERDAGKIFCLLGEKNVESGIYCIANNESRPLREFIEEMRDIYGSKAICEFNESMTSYGFVVNTKKITEAIHFVPNVGFRSGIEEIIKNRKGRHSNEESKCVDTNI